MKRLRQFWHGVLWALVVDVAGIALVFLVGPWVGALAWVLVCLGFTGVPLVNDNWKLPAGFWALQLVGWTVGLLGFWSLLQAVVHQYIQVSGQ